METILDSFFTTYFRYVHLCVPLQCCLGQICKNLFSPFLLILMPSDYFSTKFFFIIFLLVSFLFYFMGDALACMNTRREQRLHQLMENVQGDSPPKNNNKKEYGHFKINICPKEHWGIMLNLTCKITLVLPILLSKFTHSRSSPL